MSDKWITMRISVKAGSPFQAKVIAGYFRAYCKAAEGHIKETHKKNVIAYDVEVTEGDDPEPVLIDYGIV